jgi:hypothetical protein
MHKFSISVNPTYDERSRYKHHNESRIVYGDIKDEDLH